jgi:hypothetical protein
MAKRLFPILFFLLIFFSFELSAQPFPCETVPFDCSVLCGCGPNGIGDYDPIACENCLVGIPINTAIVYLLISGIAFGVSVIRGGNRKKAM